MMFALQSPSWCRLVKWFFNFQRCGRGGGGFGPPFFSPTTGLYQPRSLFCLLWWATETPDTIASVTHLRSLPSILSEIDNIYNLHFYIVSTLKKVPLIYDHTCGVLSEATRLFKTSRQASHFAKENSRDHDTGNPLLFLEEFWLLCRIKRFI